jgi:hypothetical protein
MHLSTFFEMKVHEYIFQLEVLYFQVDKSLVCMDIVSTLHIIIIIYWNFNVKYFGKFEQPTNSKHICHPLFL